MPPDNTPVVETALFCDFVRQENTGKHLLVGVFAGEIMVENFPANLQLNAFAILRFEAAANGLSVNFRTLFGGEEISKMMGRLTLSTPSTVPFVLPVALEKISEPGLLELQMDAGGSGWITVISRPISAPAKEGDGQS